jgi:integrase
MSRAHLQISLGTKDSHIAKRIAVHLDAAFDELTMDRPYMTGEQLDRMLRAEAKRQLEKLERLAAAEKAFPGFNALQAVRADKCAEWAYRLLHAQGIEVTIGAAEFERMKADGLSGEDARRVAAHIEMLRRNSVIPTPRGKLSRLVEEQGAPVTETSLAQAQSIYFRAMYLALSQHQRRYGAHYAEDDELLGQLFKERVASVQTTNDPEAKSFATVSPAASPVGTASPAPMADPLSTAGPATHSASTASDHAQGGTQDLQSHPLSVLDDLANVLVKDRKRDKAWSGKTERQFRSIKNFFIRFLEQRCNVKTIEEIRQAHLASMVECLRHNIYKYYGRSNRDFARSIDELEIIARDKKAQAEQELAAFRRRNDPSPEGRALERKLEKKADCIGVEGPTLNRHLTFLNQLIEYVRARDIALSDKVNPNKLRAKKRRDVRAREERPKISIDVVKKLFNGPLYTGNCAASDSQHLGGTEGPRVVHNSLYFVPMLLYYTGARREEITGLMIHDVIVDNGPIPYIHVADNAQRRIKNVQSMRNLPLHPEIVRLGFIDYVRQIQALNYKLVFPDLFSPTSTAPLGDRFTKQFRPLLEAAGATESGLAAHALRHLFGAQLKKRRVHEEDRGELLGHGGKSETSERYCEAHEIKLLFEKLRKIPVVTAHLRRYPIRLEPWVEKHETPPFMRRKRRQLP